MNKLIAMGVFRFVVLALAEHRKEFFGQHAKQVVLHPESFADFMGSEEIRYLIPMQADEGNIIFNNVPIVPSNETGTPKLINCKNEVVYL